MNDIFAKDLAGEIILTGIIRPSRCVPARFIKEIKNNKYGRE